MAKWPGYKVKCSVISFGRFSGHECYGHVFLVASKGATSGERVKITNLFHFNFTIQFSFHVRSKIPFDDQSFSVLSAEWQCLVSASLAK